MRSVVIDFAYPSSPTAKRFGFPASGCYVVKSTGPDCDVIVSVHASIISARREAKAHARKSGLPLHPYMTQGWRAE